MSGPGTEARGRLILTMLHGATGRFDIHHRRAVHRQPLWREAGMISAIGRVILQLRELGEIAMIDWILPKARPCLAALRSILVFACPDAPARVQIGTRARIELPSALPFHA